MTNTTTLPFSSMKTHKVYVSNIGPRGRDGISEEEMTYSKRVDFATEQVIYRGEAVVGSLNTSASWRIRRITLGDDGDVTEEWANGNASFVNVWNNRATYQYF